MNEKSPPALSQPILSAGVANIDPPEAPCHYDGVQADAWGDGWVSGYTAALASAPAAPGLTDADVQWIVNDNAELGVKIGSQFFFLYKGHSLVYESGTHDDGRPMMWRPVFKREFGECAHPLNHADYSKIGTVSLGDSEDWQALPAAPTTPKEPA